MLRSAASPGSVGFGRFGSGTSGLLMTPLPTGHLFSKGRSGLLNYIPPAGIAKGRPDRSALAARRLARRYLIFVSRNSTCFLATGSYFFFTSLSVMVREFLRVT